jgi:hypothetical protein
MSEPLKIRRFASLDVPYELTRERLDRLVGHTLGPCVHVHSVFHREHSAGLPALTRVTLRCSRPAGSADATFDVTAAEIYVSAASDSETRLEAEGHWVVCPDAKLDAALEGAAAVRVEAMLDTLARRLRRAGEPARSGSRPHPCPVDHSR